MASSPYTSPSATSPRSPPQAAPAPSSDKVDALMRMFEEERARHREAELAAESRIRLLESKLKGIEEDKKQQQSTTSTTTRNTATAAARRPASPSASSTPATRRTMTTTTTPRASTPKQTASKTSNNNNTRTPVRSTTPKATATTPTQQRTRKIAGSPEGSPSGVAALTHASSAPSSRSARLAAARARRLEDEKQQNNNNNKNKKGSRTQSWASSSGKPSAASSRNQTPVAASARTTNSRTGGNNPEHKRAWDNFCARAKDKFSASELVEISSETLQQLMDHFSITGAIERARIEAHWAFLNSDDYKNGGGAGAGGAGGRSGTPTTPRRRVTELKFPEHPDDFNLRTTVPPEMHVTPKRLLRPESPRGANIDSHEFGSGVRKPRNVHLLRSRSPATAAPTFHLQDNVPDHLKEKSGAKKIFADKNNKNNNNSNAAAAEEKPNAKKIFSKVPGAAATAASEGPAQGKKRAAAIQGAASAASAAKPAADNEPASGKKMLRRSNTDAGAAEEKRHGLRILTRNATDTRDAQRYQREQQERGTPRLVADATLSTPTMQKLLQQQQQQPAASVPAAARRLPPAKSTQPTAFQLKTPFAVDG